MIRFAISLIILVSASGSAIACSTCMVGDPTLSLMGLEKPFTNRLRISVDYLSRSEKLGLDGFNQKTIDEQRLSPDEQRLSPEHGLLRLLTIVQARVRA